MTLSKFQKFKRVSLVLIVLYSLLAILKNIFEIQFISKTWALDVVLVLGIISFYHSILWYGKKNTLIFFSITFAVAWSLETLSIHTTIPFGNYSYTDLLPGKLGDVPILIMPAYFSVGYLSWVISHIICNRQKSDYTKSDLILIPAIAAFIMTAWDVTFDPLSSTITDIWRWEGGGGYFGVPLQNFFGWYICVFIIFILFFSYIKSKPQKREVYIDDKSFWLYPTLAYIFFCVDALTRPFISVLNPNGNTSVPAIFGSDVRWRSYDIYDSLALISVFTMVLIGIITIIIIFRHSKTT